MAIDRGRSARLIRELPGLDSHGPLSESLPRIRHQFAERLVLAAKIQLTRVLVGDQGKALKFHTTILGFIRKYDFPRDYPSQDLSSNIGIFFPRRRLSIPGFCINLILSFWSITLVEAIVNCIFNPYPMSCQPSDARMTPVLSQLGLSVKAI